jgi:beta-glucosidase
MDSQKLLQELTLEEKAPLCMGNDSWQTWPVERLSIPSVRTSEARRTAAERNIQENGDVGVNDSEPATCFPPAALASCFL